MAEAQQYAEGNKVKFSYNSPERHEGILLKRYENGLWRINALISVGRYKGERITYANERTFELIKEK